MVGKAGNQNTFLQWAGIFNKSFGKGNKKVRAIKQFVIFTWIKPFKIILISHGYNIPVLFSSKEKGRGQRKKGVGRRKRIYPGEGRKRKGGVRISGGLIPRPWICKWATTSVCGGLAARLPPPLFGSRHTSQDDRQAGVSRGKIFPAIHTNHIEHILGSRSLQLCLFRGCQSDWHRIGITWKNCSLNGWGKSHIQPCTHAMTISYAGAASCPFLQTAKVHKYLGTLPLPESQYHYRYFHKSCPSAPSL